MVSAERFTELNLSTIRDALDEGMSVTRQRPAAGSKSGFEFPQATSLQPMIDKSMAYSRSAYEILAETQQEVLKLLTTQMGVFSDNFKLPTDWNGSFDMFNNGVKQFTTAANQNLSATTEAARKSAEAVLKVSKAA
ncbi:TIGR01841 family phasin [Dechloromonas sp. A34]|uniref:TIGR01841 family phasin n=1 Tax=Dechloromonas sp. A34 TaxID=447588 RepID=UPI003A5228D9